MRTYPSFPIPAVGAVVLRGDELLLVKRGSPPAIGRWSLPGGVIEVGESIEDAARRELREETGLEGDPIGVCWIVNNIVLDVGRRVKYHYIILDVLFEPSSLRGSLSPGGDALDVKWFPLDEVISSREVSRTVKELARALRSGLRLNPLVPQNNIVIEVSPSEYRSI